MVTTPTVWKAQYRIKDGDFEFDADYPPVFADIGFGQYVSVWSGVGDVPARIRDAEGNLVGEEFLVNQTDELFKEASTVASSPAGGFLALYDLLSSGQHSFFVEIFDNNGIRIGSETIIADDQNVGSLPAMAVGDDGSYLVTYSRFQTGDSTWDIVAKFVDADGELGTEAMIFDSGDVQETSSVVARLSNDSYVVVYRNFFGLGDYDVNYRLVDAAGTPGSGGQVVASFDDETDMKVAALTGGGFVVVWTDDDETSAAPAPIPASAPIPSCRHGEDRGGTDCVHRRPRCAGKVGDAVSALRTDRDERADGASRESGADLGRRPSLRAWDLGRAGQARRGCRTHRQPQGRSRRLPSGGESRARTATSCSSRRHGCWQTQSSYQGAIRNRAEGAVAPKRR